MRLPKPHSHPTGMPQRRRKSAIRTAAASVQDEFLERVREVAADPTLLLPVIVGDEPAPLARLRRRLEALRDGGRLPFSSRFDKGILGALRGVREVAAMEAAPRLLDARVDGNRRFYLQRGQAKRLVNLGVQNWDDPVALVLAYGRLGPKHGLHFFAGSELWCTGLGPKPPAQWFTDLAERSGSPLTPDAQGASCPHADRARVELRFRAKEPQRILLCGDCGPRTGEGEPRNLHGHLLTRYLSDQPARPVEVAVRLPDGTTRTPSETLLRSYRQGKTTEGELVEAAVKAWRGEVQGSGARRFVLGARDFGTDQEAFLAALELADWERAPVRALTATGHVGANAATSDVLGTHRERIADALDAMLGPGEGALFAARHPGVEVRSLLRLAKEEADRREKTRGLPELEGLGELGQWIDAFARDVRTLPRPTLLQRIRKEVSAARHPAHLFAFLCALSLESEGTRTTPRDAQEAGRHWAPLARRILESQGAAYRDAVLGYLRETGAGEGA